MHGNYFIHMLLQLCILISVLDSSLSYGQTYWKIRQLVEERTKSTIKEQLKIKYSTQSPSTNGPTPKVKTVFLEQPLDHFDVGEKRTYKQRHFVNDKFWKTPDGPVFLYIGGEGGLSPFSLLGGAHVEYAERFGALLFAVEHRFYGASISDTGLELNDIKFLSSQQALADLASFHLYASKKYNLTSGNTWVCFGGSYPGALSAWFRLKYPHLVYGAIASSAPVRAKVNFEGYNDVVAGSFSDPVVNGSEECASNIRQAFTMVDILLDKGHHKELAQDFKSCQDLSLKEDVVQFVSNLADVFMGLAQYNNEGGMNISHACQEYMAAPGEPYANLVKFFKDTHFSLFGKNCTDNSWKSYIKQLSNVTVDRDQGVGIRQWTFQTCTQFGYYQTCDAGTDCMFSKYMGLKSSLDICQDVFGIPAEEVYRRVDFTNSYYGSDQPKGTRIVFVNGSIDPWHALSVLSSLSATETAIYINGTAHCADEQSTSSRTPPAILKAKLQITERIGRWLKEAKVHNM